MFSSSGIPPSLNQGISQITDLAQFEAFCVQATDTLYDILKTAFGPYSNDKIVINHLEIPNLDSDAAKVFADLKLVNPICRVIERCCLSLSTLHNDHTTFFVLSSSILIKRIFSLFQDGFSRAEISAQLSSLFSQLYKTVDAACIRPAPEHLPTHAMRALTNALQTKLAYKADFFRTLLAPLVENKNFVDSENFLVERKFGSSFRRSCLHSGFVTSAEYHQHPGSTEDPAADRAEALELKEKNILLFACSIEKASTDTKTTLLFTEAAQLSDYLFDEEESLERVIAGIRRLGVDIVGTNCSISPLAQQLCFKHGLSVIKFVHHHELRKLARISGGDIMPVFRCPAAEAESAGAGCEAREVGRCIFKTQEIDKEQYCFFDAAEEARRGEFQTLFVFSYLDLVNEKTHRAVRRAVHAMLSVRNSGACLPGGGALEAKILADLKELKSQGEDTAREELSGFLEFFVERLAGKMGDRKDEAFDAVLKGAGKVSMDVCRKRVGESELVVDAFEGRKFAFKLLEEVVQTCLQVNEVYFTKLSGGIDLLNDPREAWDEREHTDF